MLPRPNLPSDLRFISDWIDSIPDPAERLAALELARAAMRELLTTQTERACWDLRRAERLDEARPFMSLSAARAYAVRWNGRLAHRERIRWADPFSPHRAQQFEDITHVGNFSGPDDVGTVRRRPGPDPAQ
jgi:hypothetical protein